MSKLPQTVLQKAYLLDPSVESDNPLPVFKSVGEIVSENLTLLLVILSSLIFFLVAWYLLKKKNQQTQEEELVLQPIPSKRQLSRFTNCRSKALGFCLNRLFSNSRKSFGFTLKDFSAFRLWN